MGVNIDEILASLEETEKTAEATLADNLSAPEEVATETPTDEPANEATSEETVEETTEETVDNDTVEMTEDDMAKIAAECDSQGRIMARSFVDEINRLAADDSAAVESSEDAVEETSVETEEAPVEEEKVAEEEISSADYIIGSLYNSYFKEEENNG
tara:strand:- start:5257 stop:5727 length:471 start_codon:yes stop_codon:yes gene_type:complete